MAVESRPDLIVVGAGPAGLYMALRSVGYGLTVLVLEADTEISDAPRAVSHMPVLFGEFQKAGLYDELRSFSKVHSGGVSFRRTKDQELIERIPPIPNRPGPLAIPQKDFVTIMDRKLRSTAGAQLLRGHQMTGLVQDSSREFVTVSARDMATSEVKLFEAKYVVGADGSHSEVRKVMGLQYAGATLPYKLLAADVFYPFERYGFDGANFMLDDQDYGNIAEVTEVDGERLWRVGCGFPASMSDEEIMTALPRKFEAMFPGPAPHQYRMLKAQPYQLRQMSVPRLRQGRTMIIGDAAHLANPYSGQLLAMGIFDGSSLSECLASVVREAAPETLLDEWSADRVLKFQKVMDPLSTACFNAVRDAGAETIAQRHPFLKAMKAGPGAGPPPSLETKVDTLSGFKPVSGGNRLANGDQFELIWSKA